MNNPVSDTGNNISKRTFSRASRTVRDAQGGAPQIRNGYPPRYPPRAPARPMQAQLMGPNAEAMHVQQNMRPAGTWQSNVAQVMGPAPVVARKDTSYINQQANLRSGNNQQQGGPGRQNEYQELHQSYVVFVTEPEDKQSQHRRSMEVNAVMPAVPTWMNWADQPISWNSSDHPGIMPNPGGYALVVDPTFLGPKMNVKFSRVLIDNGSSINILYKDTMEKLGVKRSTLKPTHTTFHGIVPGVSCAPMGKIWIDILFGTKENCRTECLLFEVVDLESPYRSEERRVGKEC